MEEGKEEDHRATMAITQVTKATTHTRRTNIRTGITPAPTAIPLVGKEARLTVPAMAIPIVDTERIPRLSTTQS